jgi:hypothetical protein
MKQMRKVTVRLPAKLFDRVKADTGETNAGVLRLALENLVRTAEAQRRPEEPTGR